MALINIRTRNENKERLKQKFSALMKSGATRFPLRFDVLIPDFAKHYGEAEATKFATQTVENFNLITEGFPTWEGTYAPDVLLPFVFGQDSIFYAPFVGIKDGIKDKKNFGYYEQGTCLIKDYTCAFDSDSATNTITNIEAIVQNFTVQQSLCAQDIFDTYLNNGVWDSVLSDPNLPIGLQDIWLSGILKQLTLEVQQMWVQGQFSGASLSCTYLTSQFDGILKQIIDSASSVQTTHAAITYSNIWGILADLKTTAEEANDGLIVSSGTENLTFVMSKSDAAKYGTYLANNNNINPNFPSNMKPDASNFLGIPIYAVDTPVWPSGYIALMPNSHPVNNEKMLWVNTDMNGEFENIEIGKNAPMSKTTDARIDFRLGATIPFPEFIALSSPI